MSTKHSAEALPTFLTNLDKEHRLTDRLAEILGDDKDVKKAADTVATLSKLVDRVDASWAKKAIDDMRQDPEVQALAAEYGEDLDARLAELDMLFAGNVEVTKMMVTVLMLAFSPKSGLTSLVKKDTASVLSILQALYTNGQIVANMSLDYRVEQLKLEALEDAAAKAKAEGITFTKEDYKDPAHLQALSAAAWVYSHSVGLLQKTAAEGGLWTMEVLESALRGLDLISKEQTFTDKQSELVDFVTKNKLSPLQKQLLVRFAKAIILHGVEQVLAEQKAKEAQAENASKNASKNTVDAIAHEEHDNEVHAAGLDTAANDDSEAAKKAA